MQEESSAAEDEAAFARRYYTVDVRPWNTRISSVPDTSLAKAEHFEVEGGAGAALSVSF